MISNTHDSELLRIWKTSGIVVVVIVVIVVVVRVSLLV